MFEQLRAEALEFCDVPARHDIEPEAPLSNVVRRHTRLGGKHRIDEGHMDRGEGDNIFRCRQQRGSPRKCLEARAMTIGRSTVAKPSRDRQEKFNARGIGKPRRFAIFRPSCIPPFGCCRPHRTGAVHAEQAELESVAVLHSGVACALRLRDLGVRHQCRPRVVWIAGRAGERDPSMRQDLPCLLANAVLFRRQLTSR